jgi:hypothetical protein
MPRDVKQQKGSTGSRKWWILSVLCISVRLMAIDNTIVNVALPTLNRRINASTADSQWIVTAYSLLFAGLFLVAGHLGDCMGRKRTLQVRGRDTVWNPSGHRQASRGVRDGRRGSRWPPARRRPLSSSFALSWPPGQTARPVRK